MEILIGMGIVVAACICVIYVQSEKEENIRVENWRENRHKYMD